MCGTVVGEGRTGPSVPEWLRTLQEAAQGPDRPFHITPEAAAEYASKYQAEIATLAAALRASEAALAEEKQSADSLRARLGKALDERNDLREALATMTKERDEANEALEVFENRAKERLRRIDFLERELRIVEDASRAEATKAERERCIKIIEGGAFLTADSPEVQWARAVVRLIRDDYAAIRASQPPEPAVCDECGGRRFIHTDDCPKRNHAPSSPPPPSEERLGTCLIRGATPHADDGKCIDWVPVPSPEPTKEEPSE